MKLIAALRATGSLKAKPKESWRYSKLDPHRSFVIRRVAEQDDITMQELASELAGQGTIIAPSSISRWLIRNGYRFKNVWLAPSASNFLTASQSAPTYPVSGS